MNDSHSPTLSSLCLVVCIAQHLTNSVFLLPAPVRNDWDRFWSVCGWTCTHFRWMVYTLPTFPFGLSCVFSLSLDTSLLWFFLLVFLAREHFASVNLVCVSLSVVVILSNLFNCCQIIIIYLFLLFLYNLFIILNLSSLFSLRPHFPLLRPFSTALLFACVFCIVMFVANSLELCFLAAIVANDTRAYWRWHFFCCGFHYYYTHFRFCLREG